MPLFSKKLSKTQHPLLGQRLHTAAAEIVFEASIWANIPVFLAQHQVFNTTVFPAAGYLEMALAVATTRSPSVQLTDVTISKALILKENSEKTLQFVVTAATATRTWQIFSRDPPAPTWTMHAAGKMAIAEYCNVSHIDVASIQARLTATMTANDFYALCQTRGLNYGTYFQAIVAVWQDNAEVLGHLRLPEHLETEGYTLHPVILDACFQLLVATLPQDTYTYLPVGLKKLHLFQPLPNAPLWGYARLDLSTLSADIQLATADGTVLATISGLQWKKARPEKLFST